MRLDKEEKIIVSDQFIEVYKNFNVIDQTNEIKALPKRELYLLLCIIIDNMAVDDSDYFTKVVQHNLKPYLNDEIKDIYDIQYDKIEEIKDKNIENYNILKSLIVDSDDEYINTAYIIDKDGNKLPDVSTVEEIRELKIDRIFKDNKK